MAAVNARDYWDSTKTFLGLELIGPFVVYAICLGISGSIGGLATLIRIVFALGALALLAGLVFLIASYLRALVGLWLLMFAVALVGTALVAGLRRLFGSVVDEILGSLAGVLEVVLAVVVLLVLVAVALVVLAAVSAPYYLLLGAYVDYYRSFSLGSPLAWVVPPLLALCATVGWTSARGELTHVPLVVLVLSALSLGLRTALYLDVTTGSTRVSLPEWPKVAAAFPLGVGSLAWVLGLIDPGALRDVEPALSRLFGFVAAATPFRTTGAEALVAAVFPVVLVSGSLLAARDLPRLVSGAADLASSAGELLSEPAGLSDSPSGDGGADTDDAGSAADPPGPAPSGPEERGTEVWEDDDSGSDTEVYDPDR